MNSSALHLSGIKCRNEHTVGNLVSNKPTYTVSQKKQDTELLPITSPNINHFHNS